MGIQMKKNDSIIPIERIENKIMLLRGQKVLLDRDLSALYEVETRRLVEQVKRNMKRFPSDFMFQLDRKELTNLRSQIATSSWGGLRRPPYAFTEQGVAMLSSVLNSEKAILVNIAIMRAFVQMRNILINDAKMSVKLDEIENRLDTQEINTIVLMDKLRAINDTLKAKSNKSKIGFNTDSLQK